MTTNNITNSTVTINIFNNSTDVPSYDTNIPIKICSKCKQIKHLSEFYKCKKNFDGYQYQCKNCEREFHKQYNKEYRIQNKDKISEANKEYHKVNKNKTLEYVKNQRKHNPVYRLISNNRSRIRKALHTNNKVTHSIELLGCNKDFFYKWIKWQLPYNMDDNEFQDYYHIDHCRPIASFDLSNQDEQFEAFHWSNCQPMLIKNNLSKGAKRNLWAEVMQELKANIFLKNIQ